MVHFILKNTAVLIYRIIWLCEKLLVKAIIGVIYMSFYVNKWI